MRNHEWWISHPLKTIFNDFINTIALKQHISRSNYLKELAKPLSDGSYENYLSRGQCISYIPFYRLAVMSGATITHEDIKNLCEENSQSFHSGWNDHLELLWKVIAFASDNDYLSLNNFGEDFPGVGGTFINNNPNLIVPALEKIISNQVKPIGNKILKYNKPKPGKVEVLISEKFNPLPQEIIPDPIEMYQYSIEQLLKEKLNSTNAHKIFLFLRNL